MTTKRKPRVPKPFHELLVTRLEKVSASGKDGRARFIEIAGFIEDGVCPKGRHAVRVALANALSRLGGMKSKKWSTLDRGQIKAAFDALDRQDHEESVKQRAEERSTAPAAASLNGRAVSEAPHSNVGVHT